MSRKVRFQVNSVNFGRVEGEIILSKGDKSMTEDDSPVIARSSGEIGGRSYIGDNAHTVVEFDNGGNEYYLQLPNCLILGIARAIRSAQDVQR